MATPFEAGLLEAGDAKTGVAWEPMYEAQLPSSTKVFVLYLALVLLVSAFRAISLVRQLWWLQKAHVEGSTS